MRYVNDEFYLWIDENEILIPNHEEIIKALREYF